MRTVEGGLNANFCGQFMLVLLNELLDTECREKYLLSSPGFACCSLMHGVPHVSCYGCSTSIHGPLTNTKHHHLLPLFDNFVQDDSDDSLHYMDDTAEVEKPQIAIPEGRGFVGVVGTRWGICSTFWGAHLHKLQHHGAPIQLKRCKLTFCSVA